MIARLQFILTFLTLLLSFSLLGNDNLHKLQLRENSLYISGINLLYFQDTEGVFFVDSSVSPSSIIDAFEPYTKRTPNFGFAKHDVWIAFEIENLTGNSVPGYLQFDNPILDIVDVYKWNRDEQRFEIIGKTGDQRSYSNRAVANRYLSIEAQLKTGQSSFFLIRINNGGEQFHFGISYQTDVSLLQQDHFQQFFFGIYFGIVLFVLIFNVFLYFSMREKLSLYYIFYLFSLGILQLSLNGFGKEFIWPESPYLANHINPVFASASIFFLIQFVREFLQLRRLLKYVDIAFKWISYFILLNTALATIPIHIIYYFSVIAINGVTLLLTLSIIPVAVYALKKQFKPARYFMAAFLLLVIAVGAFVLKNFGLIESNKFSDYGLQYGSALEVILLSVAIVDRFKQFRENAIKRLNELNEFRRKVNLELEQKVKERTEEVLVQKQQIEQQNQALEIKNQEVMSSISYARRIQDAILPSKEQMETLLPNHGLLYLPRDVVAGDFYWLQHATLNQTECVFFAAADCTGHGIPGAMVSVLCHNALNAALDDLQTTDTGRLLDQVDSMVKANFSNGQKQISDGMDISLVCWDKKDNVIHWSGANNPLWILRADEIIEIKADKQPIGWGQNKTPFTKHEIALVNGDKLVLFSDGFADQFGGAKGKKFKSKSLKELVLDQRHLSPFELTSHLKDVFIQWKGTQEQVDDVCICVIQVG